MSVLNCFQFSKLRDRLLLINSLPSSISNATKSSALEMAGSGSFDIRHLETEHLSLSRLVILIIPVSMNAESFMHLTC